MISKDYRTWQDFLKEETQRLSWVSVGVGVYKKGGVMLKIAKIQGKGFQVVSFLEHPVHGNTALVRHNISREEFIEILKNPRVHTDKGFIPNSPKRRLDSLYNKINQENQ